MQYLGPLSNDLLEAEAGSWSCFLHPIFCYARGASTKLATALAWEIPVVTTSTGRRGYVWTDGDLPVANAPEGFARLADSMLDRARAAEAREQVRRVSRSSPTLDDIAATIRAVLEVA